jgi:hypothetical protein
MPRINRVTGQSLGFLLDYKKVFNRFSTKKSRFMIRFSNHIRQRSPVSFLGLNHRTKSQDQSL